MALVAHSDLPSFERLRQEGCEVLSPQQAQRLEARELRIGLLNMMPDAALRATERQFLRLVGDCNPLLPVRVYPFAVALEDRGDDAQSYVHDHYWTFQATQEIGLDALIVTGANPKSADITSEAFWQPLVKVLAWAQQNVVSTLCSCLATHAVLKLYSGVERTRRPSKLWGVFSHRVTDTAHPLVRGVPLQFDAPRSQVFEVSAARIEESGNRVLANSQDVGCHLATSADGISFVFLQGHPEYDADSLLKEYKREVQRFVRGERQDFPPHPVGYITTRAARILADHEQATLAASDAGEAPPKVPESEVLPQLENTWVDAGKTIYANWLGMIYSKAER